MDPITLSLISLCVLTGAELIYKTVKRVNRSRCTSHGISLSMDETAKE